jgi:hypothetical protein
VSPTGTHATIVPAKSNSALLIGLAPGGL